MVHMYTPFQCRILGRCQSQLCMKEEGDANNLL